MRYLIAILVMMTVLLASISCSQAEEGTIPGNGDLQPITQAQPDVHRAGSGTHRRGTSVHRARSDIHPARTGTRNPRREDLGRRRLQRSQPGNQR